MDKALTGQLAATLRAASEIILGKERELRLAVA